MSVANFGSNVAASFAVVSLIALAGCASVHKAARSLVGASSAAPSIRTTDHASGAVPSEAPDAYRESVTALDAGKYDEALKGFDRFTQQNAASAWSQAAMLNSGRALEGLKRWPEAIERYRQVVNSTGTAPRLQAMALYRLSYGHEALADDAQVVVDLNDLLARTSALPTEIAQAELPARLAAAYARVGNFDRAQDFYKRAELGIARLRQKSAGQIPDWLPRTLFLMGDSSRRQISWVDFETGLRPLARNQVYLLEAAELGVDPWATRAAEQLSVAYRELMTTLEGAPIPDGDALLAKRAVQRKQWERAALLVDTMTELRARAAPGAKTPAVETIRKALDQTDKRIANLFAERPAGEGLTAAALARRKFGKKLRALPTDDSLEQKFLRSSRDSGRESKTDVAPTAAPSTPVEDPNL